jgi:periplasmic protein TonB
MKPSSRWMPVLAFSLAALTGVPHAAIGQEIAPRGTTMMPRVLKEVKPDYTPEAKKQRIEGLVAMSVVVKEDGTVGDVEVTRSLDKKFGLDEQAVIAMKKWRFKPGARDGKPVAVRVDVEMTFALK